MRLTNAEGLLSDASHYEEAARCQRIRAAKAETASVRAECIERAMLYTDKARQCRQEAQAQKPKRKKYRPPANDGWDIPF